MRAVGRAVLRADFRKQLRVIRAQERCTITFKLAKARRADWRNADVTDFATHGPDGPTSHIESRPVAPDRNPIVLLGEGKVGLAVDGVPRCANDVEDVGGRALEEFHIEAITKHRSRSER